MLQNIRIVLVETSHTGNMGSVARAMKTMGLTNLWLVNPLVKPDSQAIALAAGAVRFGFAALGHLSIAGLSRTVLVSVLVGAGLSLLGVVYPAILAARMRPIEAMRAQE